MPKKNLAYNIIYQIFILIMPLLTAPYVSRIFGPEGVGRYSFNYTVATYFVYFCLLGINNYGVRMIAKCKEVDERNQTFSNIYFVQFTVSLIVLLIYLFYTFFLNTDDIIIKLCFLPYVVSGMLDINWFFFGTEKFALTTIRNCLVKILTIISIFVFIKKSSHIYLYCFIMSSAYLLTQLIMWASLIGTVKRIKKPNYSEYIAHLKGMLALFVPVIAVSLYRLMDKLMIGFLSSNKELGYYECAEQIIGVPATLATALGTTMLPRMTSLLAKNNKDDFDAFFKKSLLFVEFLCFPMAFGIISISSIFMPVFYGESFWPSSLTLDILCASFVFSSIASVIRTQYLIPKNRDKIYVSSVIFGAASNIVLNLIFIPLFGANGAALGTVGANFIVALIQFVATQKEYKEVHSIKNGLVFLPCAIIMFIVILCFNNLIMIENNYLIIFYDIIVGVLSYSILSFPILYFCKRTNFL